MRLRRYELGDRVDATAAFRAEYEASGCELPPGAKFSLVARVDGREVVRGIAGFQTLGGIQLGAWAYMADLSPKEWVRAARLARTACGWATALGGKAVYATPHDTDEARRLLAYIGFRPSPDDAGVWKFKGSDD